MASGRANQLTKQIGEYLVAAALGRLGLVAATFSGNVPDYDIVATDSEFSSVLVQVKAVTGTSWQFDIRRFVDIQLAGRRQVIGRPVPVSSEIVCVMVALASHGSDRFYILPLKKLQGLLIEGHRRYLAKHGGVRPKKYDSFHCAISEKDLAPFKDGWLVEFRDNRGLRVNGIGA